MALRRLNSVTGRGRDIGSVPTEKPPTQDRRAGSLSGRQHESSGIQAFLGHLEGTSGLHILDLGAVSQDTASHLGRLGHHIHFVSLLHAFDTVHEAGLDSEGRMRSQAANRFVRSYLDYPKNSFDGVLAWDVLQHLDEVTMRTTIAYLSQIMRPDSIMLSLFHADYAGGTHPVLNCSVISDETLVLREVGRRVSKWRTSVRDLELLFAEFRAVHFYLKRDALFEVLVFG